MTSGKRTTAFALAGAIALASGAYALGNEAGDGSAEAAKGDQVRHGHGFGPPGRPGFRPGFDDLADRLGVEETALREALEGIADERKAQFAQRLADALNIDRAKVEEAFENLRPERPHMRRPRGLPAALAKELGLSTAKVRAALEQGRRGPGELADALGVSEERLREAFHAVIGKPRRLHRPGLSNLADELGVTQAQLDEAFEELRDDFTQQLADRLNLDVAKVEEALEATPRFGGRRGP
ncbi:MAG TPA: Clp protease N-terminal domain-containing protein [Solirubrobacteraceae bacterium]|nr:Clp protease N-terminal domain-containing protein [Solirubrobacteraceae bacterium]